MKLIYARPPFFRLFAFLAAAVSTAFALPEGIEHVQTLDGIEEYRLESNGLRVLLMPNEGLPVATVMVTYEVGSRNEVTGTTGATHILEHMMFKGTDRFNSKDGTDYSSVMERIGARSNATTYFDRTNYYATLPSQYVPLAIELEADRLRGLRIREEDLASEMTVVRNEYERGENNPVRTLIKEIYAAAFMAQPYGHPTIGWRSDIESTNPEKLRAFYDLFYWPENAVLTLIGGFDRDEALTAIQKFYGPVPKAPAAIPTMETVEPEQLGPRRLVIERSGQVGVVMLAFKVPEGLHADWAALHIIQEILGADKTGRLYRELEDKGKASATFTFAPQLRDPGLFMLAAYLTPDATHEETEAIILKEIEKLIESGVSDDELARAKSVIRTRTVYGRDGPYAIADDLNEYIAMGDWTQFIRLPQAVETVTAADVRKVAETYLQARRSTTGWYVPTSSAPASAQATATTGPRYFRENDLPGPEQRAPDSPTMGKEPEIDFASRMHRATVADIDVIAVEMPVTDVVSFVGSFAAGDSMSPDDAPSLASLTAAMLDKGTARNDRFTIAEKLAGMGAVIHFGADSHHLEFSGKFLRKDAAEVMRLLAEQLQEPAFDPAVLETLKQRIKSGLLNSIDNPDYRAQAAISRMLYPVGHPNHTREIESLLTELDATQIEDILAFHKEHYGPRSMRIVFAGDVDFEALGSAVQSAFGDWDGGVDYPEHPLPALDNALHSKSIRIDDKTSISVRQAYHTGLQRTEPEYIPFMIGNYILGSGFQSRLMTDVRKEKGLTYAINTWHEGDLLTPGHWMLQASFAPQNLNDGIAAIHSVVDEWYTNGVTEQEVAAAIETLTGSYLVGLSTTDRVANQVLSFIQRGFEPEYIDIYPKQLLTVDRETVNSAIRKHLDPEKISQAIAGSILDETSGATEPSDDTPEPESPTATEIPRTLTIRLDTPDRGWRVAIEQVYQTKDGILVISRLSRGDGIAAQVISTVSDQVTIPAPAELPVRHYVLGKTWDWGAGGNMAFIASMDDFGTALETAELLYERKTE